MPVPYFQVYPGDYQKHLGFRRATREQKGLYFDLLLLMAEGSERGVLIFADQPLTKAEIAGVVGGDQEVTLRAIEELIRLGLVFVRNDGALYSPELVAQEKERQNSAKRQKAHRERNGQVTPMSRGDNGKVTAESPPSSSSSSSSSSERETRAREDSRQPQSKCVGPNDDFDTDLPAREWTMGERFILKACQLWEKPILETDWRLRQTVQGFGKWVEERVDPKHHKGGRPEWFQEFWFQVLRRTIAPRPEYLIEQWDAYDRWLIETYETHRA